MNTNAHERARNLIALAASEKLPGADQAWLTAHVETCAVCCAFVENMAEMIHGLRAIPIAADRTLVAATQARVRRRALELQGHRERLWLVCVSCMAVTLCALLSTVALWRCFAWLGTQIQLAPSIWQVGFFVFCLTPALVSGVLLLARDTYLADDVSSYQG